MWACLQEGRDGDGAELAWDSGYANGAAPGDDRATSDAAVSDPMVTSLGSSNATASRATGNKQAAKQVSFAAAHAAEAGRVDDSYFESYSYLDIHREMLSDTVRRGGVVWCAHTARGGGVDSAFVSCPRFGFAGDRVSL